MATETMRDKLADLSKKVVKLKDKDGLSWSDIAEQLETSPGKAMLAYDFGQVSEGDIVTAKTDEALGAKIAKMRDNEALSWGKIMALTNLGEQRCRTLYEGATGTSTKGNRIGKGGRHPGLANGVKKVAKATKATKATKAVKKSSPAKKATAKKVAPAKKAARAKKSAPSGLAKGQDAPAAKTGASSLEAMTLEELQTRLEGRKIGVERVGSERLSTIEVRKVLTLDNGEVQILDARTGNKRTVFVRSIRKAQR